MVTNTVQPHPESDKGLIKLNRKPGEEIFIDERIKITRTLDGWRLMDGEIEIDLNNGTPGRGSCAVNAPRSVPVRRGELPKHAA